MQHYTPFLITITLSISRLHNTCTHLSRKTQTPHNSHFRLASSINTRKRANGDRAILGLSRAHVEKSRRGNPWNARVKVLLRDKKKGDRESARTCNARAVCVCINESLAPSLHTRPYSYRSPDSLPAAERKESPLNIQVYWISSSRLRAPYTARIATNRVVCMRKKNVFLSRLT